VIDTDYWLTNDNVEGRYRIDGGTETVTQDAYGVDVRIQDASISADWDLMAYSSI
jgi:hypothetical protein